MSTTVYADISSALDEHLSTMPSLPSVAWENSSFEPVAGTLYLRPFTLPANTEQAGLGTTGIDEHIGIYQIDINAPAGNGKSEAVLMADTLATRFKRGTDLVYNGAEVRLGNVSRSAGRVTGDRFIIVLTINYSAHIAPR